MAIVITKRPNTRNWSGNPIHYRLYSEDAVSDNTIFFEISIMFKQTGTSVFTEVVTLPYNPVNGEAKIDIESILDGMLEYETPALPSANEYTTPLFAKKMTGEFFIMFREITTDEPDPEWDDTESDFVRFVIKGGISWSKWRGDNYWVNHFDVNKPFLTWELNNKLAAITERMYLAWLNMTALAPAEIKMKRKLAFTDGTFDNATYDMPANLNEVVFFPSGGSQLNLATINPAKKIYYWELVVWDILNDAALSETFRYYKDNRHDRNAITLNYRNSLGGINSARVRGVIDYKLEREFTQQERIVLHNYFEGNAIQPRIRAGNSYEILMYEGNIGFLGKEEQDRMRDIHFQREVWWEQQLKWLPVALMTGSDTMKKSTDMLWNMKVVFAIASAGEKYYTPQSINLAEGGVASALECTAVITDLAAVENGEGADVSWALDSGLPAKYLVSTPGVNGGVAVETTDLAYTFSFIPIGTNVITVTPVCLINGEYILGNPVTVEYVKAAACVPVTIPGTVAFPNAIKDVAYSYSFDVPGTAPITLDNIVKPAWMTLSITGNTVTASGTPGEGDVAEDVPVSFDLTNCGGTVSFDDDINVVANNFRISNDTGWEIVACFPALIPITPDTYPILSGESFDGFHTYFSGALAVVIIGESTPASLQLLKNDVVIQSLAVNVADTYFFNSEIFATADDMKVRLI